MGDPYVEMVSGAISHAEIEFYEDRRKVKSVILGFQDLHKLISVPEGNRIVQVHYDPLREGIILTIQNENFEPVAPGCEPPIMQKEFKIFEDCPHGVSHMFIEFDPEETNG